MIAINWASLLNLLSISRSRATIWRSSSARSSCGPRAILFMPCTSSASVSATTKSTPCCLNASTGPGAPLATRLLRVSLMSLPVMSGFCSDPEFIVALVSKPGKHGAGSRFPVASNHIEEGPGMMRIAWSGQTGSQLWMPSV
ncbi:Uncharacterised protein [Mycobacteroides abscessus subsp. abscessus]|nr:Uncharacterised protein [Mycobacteroides abscessus subsp. abscessus]